jgi:hypothetical protein
MKIGFDLPPDAQQHLDLAYSYEKSEDFEEALRECAIVLKTNPFCAEAHNLRGMILEGLGRRAEAMQAYEIATQLDPEFVEAAQNLSEAKSEIKARNRLEVKSSTFFKIALGGMALFFLCIAGVFLHMLTSSLESWPLVVLLLGGCAAPGLFLWWNQRRYPRVIDEEGITTRNGCRVLWKDLAKVERITGRAYGVRVSGSLRLHFRDGEIVDIVPNSITPADQVVHYVARKTGAYPG